MSKGTTAGFTKDDFIYLAKLCGYASKRSPEKYVEEHPKDQYDDDDFRALYEGGMHWEECSSVRGMRYAARCNGRTTAFSNGIRYDSSGYQDFDTSK